MRRLRLVVIPFAVGVVEFVTAASASGYFRTK
jgi:hypothetical protein